MKKYKIEVLVNATNRRGRIRELSRGFTGGSTSKAITKMKGYLKHLQDAGYTLITVTTFGYWL